MLFVIVLLKYTVQSILHTAYAVKSIKFARSKFRTFTAADILALRKSRKSLYRNKLINFIGTR